MKLIAAYHHSMTLLILVGSSWNSLIKWTGILAQLRAYLHEHTCRYADIRNNHLAAKFTTWQQHVTRLFPEECHRQIRLDASSARLACRSIHSRRNIDRDNRSIPAIDLVGQFRWKISRQNGHGSPSG